MDFAFAFRLLRSTVVLVVAALVALPVAQAWHGSQVKNTWGGEGPAIKGYDPVAYFTIGEATPGSEQFTHEWLGATWQFANEEHRDLFAAAPAKYAPQHGGYCAVGASGGGSFSADPTAWRIEDDKLYLFYSSKTASKFDPRSPDVAKADASWQNQLLDLMKH